MGGLVCVGGWRSWGLNKVEFECREKEGMEMGGLFQHTHTHTHTRLSVCGWGGVAWRWEIHTFEATTKIDIVQGE
jgi:hypothetical protein